MGIDITRKTFTSKYLRIGYSKHTNSKACEYQTDIENIFVRFVSFSPKYKTCITVQLAAQVDNESCAYKDRSSCSSNGDN